MIVVTDKEKNTIKNIEKLDLDALKASMIYMQGMQAAMLLLADGKENKTA